MARRFTGQVTVWNKETGEPMHVWAVDARDLIKQGEYQGYPVGEEASPPPPFEPPPLEPPPPAGDVLFATFGPPELDDWTVKDLKTHLLDRFNEKYKQDKTPRKSDLVRHLRSLYRDEELAENDSEE